MDRPGGAGIGHQHRPRIYDQIHLDAHIDRCQNEQLTADVGFLGFTMRLSTLENVIQHLINHLINLFRV